MSTIYGQNLSLDENNLFCNETDCFFPGENLGSEDITVDGSFQLSSDKNLVIHTMKDIIFEKDSEIDCKNNLSILARGVVNLNNSKILARGQLMIIARGDVPKTKNEEGGPNREWGVIGRRWECVKDCFFWCCGHDFVEVYGWKGN